MTGVIAAVKQLQPEIGKWFLNATLEQIEMVITFTDEELLQLFAPLPEDDLPADIFERMAAIEQRRNHIADTGEMVTEEQ